MTTNVPLKSHVWSFPRIGASRELKKAVESYRNGTINQDQLLKAAAELY
jgi:hypothetical protein